MRPPPPVSIELGAAHSWRALQASLHALAAASVLAWACAALDLAGPAWPFTVVAVAALAATAGWRHSRPVGVSLAWTGAGWLLRPRADPRAAWPLELPVPAIDLGPWMLLRAARPGRGGRLWLVATRAAAGPAWHPFRAAVYSFDPSSTLRSVEERPLP